MTNKSRGFRQSTRKKLRQKPSFRPPITKFLREFNEGQNVVIELEPSSQKGMPFPRFKGKIGKVIGKNGRSYIVELFDGRKMKKITSRPEHLKAI
ncbi:MAG: 50S ribosomal protein L21e [Candidatus Aenigmarchaeota archaeon]|nr:50S ribosomal protein L21e [Candidatus Aenigmarchaeota archaeon]